MIIFCGHHARDASMCSLSRPCPFSRCQDVLKTRAQLHAGGGEGMAAILRGIVREQGVAGLYRGIASPIFAEAPKRAWKFTANGVLRDQGAHPVAAGAAAGFTEALVNTPFETVKVQMQAKENLGRFKGTADCAAQLLRGEGPLGFYKGFQAQAMPVETQNSPQHTLQHIEYNVYDALHSVL